jgi:DNA repair exonuclease SbcCD nuclease subunit
VLLCGDTFECNRLSSKVLAQSADLLAKAGRPVVILPGNHDPVMEDSVFHKGRLHDIENVSVIGLTHEMSVEFPHLDLEVWGRAHRDYGDMIPFETIRPRRARWHVAMAHGHYVPVPDRITRPRASWLIGDDEIKATGADYLALGHWNRAVKVGCGAVPAFYSGSPDYARTVNVVRLRASGEVLVDRHDLHWPEPREH